MSDFSETMQARLEKSEIFKDVWNRHCEALCFVNVFSKTKEKSKQRKSVTC